MKHFDKARYHSPNRKNEEPEPHKKARLKLESLIERHGGKPEIEPKKKKVTLQTALGERTFECDSLAYYANEQVLDGEVDGESHNDEGYLSRSFKDDVRNEAMISAGYSVARFSVEELIGDFALSDEEVFRQLSKALMNGIRKVDDK